MDVQAWTTEELKKNLITSDYKGKEVKQRCLDELIRRAVEGARNKPPEDLEITPGRRDTLGDTLLLQLRRDVLGLEHSYRALKQEVENLKEGCFSDGC